MKKVHLIIFGAVLALWVLISPWVLGFSEFDVARWSNVFTGVLLGLTLLWISFFEV